MLKKIFSTKYLLFAILVLAAFLRLYRIGDYMTFLGDEGRDVLVAYNILHGHLTLLGPTASVGGFFFGPLYYYMMAPFLFLFNYNPVGPAIMIALLGIGTVWLVYMLGALFFSKPVGLIAAFLYATAPIIVSYSRSSWNPNPVPFFAFLLIILFYKAVTQQVKRRLTVFFLVGLLLGILVELHFVTSVLVLVIFPYLLLHFFLFEKRSSWKDSLLIPSFYIFLGFVVGMLPYLGFEVRHGFPNVRSFIQFTLFSGKVTASGNGLVTLGNVFLRLFGRILMNAEPIEHVTKITQLLINEYIFPAILGIFSSVLIIFQLYKAHKEHDKKQIGKAFLIVNWFVGGIIIFAFYHKAIYDYYFGFMYAIPFLLAANLLVWLWIRRSIGKVIAIVLFSFLIAPNILGVPFRYSPNRQLLQTETIAKEVLKMTNNQPYNFALITGGNSDHAYRYFLTLWGHPPVTIQYPGADPERKTITKQLIVVCESLPCSPLGVSLWEVAGFGRADILEKKHIIVVDVFKLGHYIGK